jgi:hypothetical protein
VQNLFELNTWGGGNIHRDLPFNFARFSGFFSERPQLIIDPFHYS